MEMKQSEKVILISGGSRGLGRDLVETMLNNGNHVASFSRSSTPFIEASLKAHPEAFCWQAVDGADSQAVKRFAMTVIRRFGRIDVLINNAGIGADGIFTLMPEDDIHRMIALNLEAALYLSRACLKSMMEQKQGCIINITSVNGIRGHTGVAVYSATKAALDGFTRSLAREMGPLGIRINSVAPGYFESEMSHTLSDNQKARITRRTPLGRMGTTQDVAGVIQFLISADAGFITGQTVAVDGGLSC